LRNNKGLATGLTSLLQPNLISNFRWGITRVGWEDTGIAKFSAVTLRGLDSPVGLTRGFAAIIPTYTLAEDMTWTKGAHNLQFGAVIRWTRNRRNTDQNSWSSAVANASWLVDSGAGLNRPWPDMATSQITYFRYAVTDVLGLVTQGNAQYNYKVDGTVLKEGEPVFRNFANEEYEFYIQDNWRITRGLTLTGGLRYSLMPPYYEKNGQQVSPNIPIGEWFQPARRPGHARQARKWRRAASPSFPETRAGGLSMRFHKKNFRPASGPGLLARRAASGLSKFFFGGPGRSVIRAGWGMFYDLFGSGLMRAYDSTAFGLSTRLVNPSAVLDRQHGPPLHRY
jgi:hypothetical protein